MTLSISEAREILGPENSDLTDAEIQEVLDRFSVVVINLLELRRRGEL